MTIDILEQQIRAQGDDIKALAVSQAKITERLDNALHKISNIHQEITAKFMQGHDIEIRIHDLEEFKKNHLLKKGFFEKYWRAIIMVLVAGGVVETIGRHFGFKL